MQQVDDITRDAETRHEDARAAVDDRLDTGLHLTGDGSEQIHTERLLRPLAHVRHLVGQFGWPQLCCTERADAARLRDGCDEPVVRHTAHARQHHGVFDVEEVGKACPHAANGSGLRPR